MMLHMIKVNRSSGVVSLVFELYSAALSHLCVKSCGAHDQHTVVPWVCMHFSISRSEERWNSHFVAANEYTPLYLRHPRHRLPNSQLSLKSKQFSQVLISALAALFKEAQWEIGASSSNTSNIHQQGERLRQPIVGTK